MLKRKLCQNKAQSTLEYATIIVCVVAALLAMQTYIKRGVQGKLRQSADELGQQYAPRNTTGTHTLTYKSNSTTIARTKSEKELGFDLDEDGIIENDVFGTTANTTINATAQQKGSETIYGEGL